MFTVADVIDEARDFHPAFTERQTPTSAAVRAFDRAEAALYAAILKRDRYILMDTETISFPLADFSAGYSPTATVQTPLGGDVYFNGSDPESHVPLTFINWGERYSPHCRWPAWLEGSVIHFAGASSDWISVDHVVLAYIPARTVVTSRGDNSGLPDEARPVMAEKLAMFMAARGPQGTVGEGPIELNLTVAQIDHDEKALLSLLSMKRRTSTGYTREVW